MNVFISKPNHSLVIFTYYYHYVVHAFVVENNTTKESTAPLANSKASVYGHIGSPVLHNKSNYKTRATSKSIYAGTCVCWTAFGIHPSADSIVHINNIFSVKLRMFSYPSV